MGKAQKIVCIILGVFVLGMVFSMTPYYKPIKEFFVGPSKDNSSEASFGPSSTLLSGVTKDVETPHSYSFSCRTTDALLVKLVSEDKISDKRKMDIAREISRVYFSDLKSHLDTNDRWYITNIVISKKADVFFATDKTISVGGNEVVAEGVIKY